MSLTEQSSDLRQKSLELANLLKERQDRHRFYLLKTYRPYSKQADFHAAGLEHNERMFMAGNQLGKTWAGAFEWAMHLTGRYPDWWQGRRFEEPVKFWCAGVTATSTRDNPQRLLIGPPSDPDQWGTGAIPKECIIDHSNARSVADAIDVIHVKHITGGTSYLWFKTYEMGRKKWQGETLDGVWFDEEPPLDIYSEGLTRTQKKGQFSMLTFTPLEGASDVVMLFLSEAQLKELK